MLISGIGLSASPSACDQLHVEGHFAQQFFTNCFSSKWPGFLDQLTNFSIARTFQICLGFVIEFLQTRGSFLGVTGDLFACPSHEGSILFTRSILENKHPAF